MFGPERGFIPLHPIFAHRHDIRLAITIDIGSIDGVTDRADLGIDNLLDKPGSAGQSRFRFRFHSGHDEQGSNDGQ